MSANNLRFPPPRLPDEVAELRAELRAFLAESSAAEPWLPNSDFGAGFSPEFSRKIADKGWIGMTWPKHYGGGERSHLERYVVTEELLAAGAPVFAHWIADRQSGPLLLRFGSQSQRAELLPRIAAGECFFSIGMSEPDSGSDLASVRTRAERTAHGWRLNGAKVWTSNAHLNHYMITLCRTGDAGEDRHGGLSQFLIDLRQDGVTINPIVNMLGAHEFNEVVFDNVEIPLDRLIGQEGEGWRQVTSELAYERSGPERFLSNFHIFQALVDEIGPAPDARQAEALGRLTARLWTLRRMSLSVAAMLQAGESPDVEAAIVKELGNKFEREVVETARAVLPVQPTITAGGNSADFPAMLAEALLRLPSFTLRGGTTEIMRSIIARGLGLR
ncbi:MAG: acyl-CoA dehydrogenase family protein [Proteobacteria bacterium]|nr:acyl-CoA dehydrogenase family protein [Pseudomonadota bacterium]MDA1357145.1 acyl-CoA dehydrogenase family protein [Pseudomonadota bacterium]